MCYCRWQLDSPQDSEPSQYQHTQVATNDLLMITFLTNVLMRVCDDYYLTISMLLLAVLNAQDGIMMRRS